MISFEELYYLMASRPDIFSPVSDSDLRKIQSKSFEIYLFFQSFCLERGLNVMLGGGSALGAKRHGGFIPWDDDIDVFMPRKDYELLLKRFCNELPSNLYLCAPNGPYSAEKRHAVLYDSTKAVEDIPPDDYRKCIGIDIFPLENYPSNQLIHKIKWPIYVAFSLAASTTRLWSDRKTPTTYNQAIVLTRKGRNEYKFRLMIGFLFSFFSFHKWLDISDSFISNCKPSGRVYIPSIFGSVNMPVDSGIMSPPSWGTFEGIQVLLPHSPEGYLEYEYGNWQELPPVEKRRQHNYKLIKK